MNGMAIAASVGEAGCVGARPWSSGRLRRARARRPSSAARPWARGSSRWRAGPVGSLSSSGTIASWPSRSNPLARQRVPDAASTIGCRCLVGLPGDVDSGKRCAPSHEKGLARKGCAATDTSVPDGRRSTDRAARGGPSTRRKQSTARPGTGANRLRATVPMAADQLAAPARLSPLGSSERAVEARGLVEGRRARGELVLATDAEPTGRAWDRVLVTRRRRPVAPVSAPSTRGRVL